MAFLLISLFFIVGVTISQYILNEKLAHATTSVNLGKLTTGTVLGNPSIIGIQLSSTCVKMVQQNQTNDCPSYYQLRSMDTTNQMLSGKFKFTNGYYHRGNPQTSNHYQMYKTGQIVIMLDPDYASMYFGQTIIIVPKGFTYKLNADQVKNGTRQQYYDRYVTSDCKQATISYSEQLLNDTITYLESSCKITSFNEKKDIPLPVHPPDYKDAAWYKYYAWLQIAKKQHSENCITKKCVMPDTRWKK